MLRGNFLFALKNWKFAGILGFSYAPLGLLVLMWNDLSGVTEVLINPPLWGVITLLGFIYWHYADGSNWVKRGKIVWAQGSERKRKLVLAGSHTAAHVCIIIMLTHCLYRFGIDRLDLTFWTWCFNGFFVASMTILSGLICGTIFGLYLYLTCRFLSIHPNEAFSSMSLDSYKNFLRIRIKGDKLTLYPIGIDQVPAGSDWQPNPDASKGESESWVKPREPLSYRLIEEPIDF